MYTFILIMTTTTTIIIIKTKGRKSKKTILGPKKPEKLMKTNKEKLGKMLEFFILHMNYMKDAINCWRT